jgi:predicted metal-dependent hydrolase
LGVSKKSAAIALLIEGLQGQRLPAHYLGYFACFNRELFYESHDVLEELWLAHRNGPNDGFYKGLIQFAGAFVHLRKNRLRPAAALLRLSQSYLRGYPSVHEQLDVDRILRIADEWLAKLEAGQFEVNPLETNATPKLELTA